MAGLTTIFVVLVAGVAAATSMALRARRAEAEAQAVNDFLQTDLLAQAGASAQAGPNAKPDPQLQVGTVLDRAAARIPGKFEKQPLVEASIRQTIGATYQDLGLIDQAQQQFERSLAIHERTLGDDNLATRQSMDHLATLYRLEGKYALAEPLRKNILEARKRLLGNRHRDTLDAMNNLALLYRYERKRDLAEPLFNQPLDRLQGHKGVERQKLTIMANLAQLYQDQAKYSQAEHLFKEVLKDAPGVFGEEHPATLVFMNNLAQVYQDEGRLAEAESLQRTVTDADSRILGPEHPNTLMDLGNMAKMYQSEQRKYGLAETNFREALQRYIKLRPNGWQRYNCASLLGQSLARERRYVEAEPLLVSGYEGLIQRRAKMSAINRPYFDSAGEQVGPRREDRRSTPGGASAGRGDRGDRGVGGAAVPLLANPRALFHHSLPDKRTFDNGPIEFRGIHPQ